VCRVVKNPCILDGLGNVYIFNVLAYLLSAAIIKCGSEANIQRSDVVILSIYLLTN
jgi:hypothetical protein